MKRLFVVAIALLNLILCANAQKKEIAQAQTYIKSGKNLDKAEADMRKLLLDSANLSNIKICHTLAEAIRMQYEQGNEQLYLKQKYDTASLFLIANRLFKAYESLDSLDATPDEKGRVKLKYRKHNAEYLDRYRKNLFIGGGFFLSKQNYKSAFDMFDTFLECVSQPLFSSLKYGSDNDIARKAAYYATSCGVKLNNSDLALKYHKEALEYTPGRENTLRYLSGIYESRKDTAKYLQFLRLGLEEFPKSEYFFTRTIDFYTSTNRQDSALTIASRSIAADPHNTLFLYAKSNILLNIGKYDECITVCDTIISLNDSIADAYYNAGVSYLNLAFEKEKKGNKKNKAEITGYYKSSLPYLEKFRELAPEQKDKWAAALYNIYLNLNMGKKFEEISKILMN